MASAKVAYRQMLTNEIGPDLGAAGLTGAGERWELRSRESYALVGFRRGKFSTDERVTFTVDLQVIARSVWTSYRSKPHEQPDPSVGYAGQGQPGSGGVRFLPSFESGRTLTGCWYEPSPSLLRRSR
jgi:hypothetical protein